MTLKQYSLSLHKMHYPARIGIYPNEKLTPQQIQLEIDLGVHIDKCTFDNADGVPCYATLAEGIRHLLVAEHHDLCEQLVQKIADYCFEDSRIFTVDIQLYKPQAIAGMHVGIKSEFQRSDSVL